MNLRFTICAYDGSGYFGGPLEWYKRLAPALRQIGVETEFLFITDHTPKLCNTYLHLKKQGFKCHALRRHSLSQLRDNTEARVRWILKHIRRSPPDLFIANLSIPGCFAGRWIQEAGIPTVPVLHSDDNFYRGMVDLFFTRHSAFRLNTVVCVSKMLVDWIHSKTDDNISVACIPCGTPIPNELTGYSKENLRLVYVGRLVQKAKRIRDVAKTFCRVGKIIENVEAVFIGDGPDRQSVESIIQEEGCGTKIRLLGKLNSHHIQQKLLNYHIIVLLSEYEGLPIALLEGMACGLVPVCLNIRSGISELVMHGKTGILVNNEDEFIDAIQLLKYDTDLWQKLSRNARQLVRQEYSMEVVAKRWKQLAIDLNQRIKNRKSVRIPSNLELPPIQPNTVSDDRRWLGWRMYSLMQCKRAIRRLHRQSGEVSKQ